MAATPYGTNGYRERALLQALDTMLSRGRTIDPSSKANLVQSLANILQSKDPHFRDFSLFARVTVVQRPSSITYISTNKETGKVTIKSDVPETERSNYETRTLPTIGNKKIIPSDLAELIRDKKATVEFDGKALESEDIVTEEEVAFADQVVDQVFQELERRKVQIEKNREAESKTETKPDTGPAFSKATEQQAERAKAGKEASTMVYEAARRGVEKAERANDQNRLNQEKATEEARREKELRKHLDEKHQVIQEHADAKNLENEQLRKSQIQGNQE